MKDMSSSRAEALRILLGLTYEDVAHGINRLAGTDYGYADTYRWFRDKTRKPTIALAIYLRMVLRAQWRARCARRERPQHNALGTLERVTQFLEEAAPAMVARFEKRLRLSEMDLEAARFKVEC